MPSIKRRHFQRPRMISNPDKKTQKTKEQHLIVRSGKSEVEVTIRKDCARGIVSLKLTTDGQEASRGLSVTAGLLVPL